MRDNKLIFHVNKVRYHLLYVLKRELKNNGLILPIERRYFVTDNGLVLGKRCSRHSGVAVPENKYSHDLEHGEQYLFKASCITGFQTIKKKKNTKQLLYI